MAGISITSVVISLGLTVSAMNGPGNPRDFIGIYRPESINSAYIDWMYLNGTKNLPQTGLTGGTAKFNISNASGKYEARFLSVAGTTTKVFTLLAKGQTVTANDDGLLTAINISPTAVTLSDDSSVGTLICTVTPVLSDGSVFKGSLKLSSNDFLAIAGLNIITSRPLTSADDGLKTITITASQGGALVSIDAPINISGAP